LSGIITTLTEFCIAAVLVVLVLQIQSDYDCEPKTLLLM